MLLSIVLVIPMVVEAGRGHHHDHYRHHHHDHHRHHHHNHYNTRNIYYNQSYYPPAYPPAYGGYYGVAPRNFFFGSNTGNARFMLGY
ncbi:hypothetical protein [Nitrosomonas sp. Nm34]|uniref:hypothetical protein n=1 Tax=Nitrosomonas sp. Nm34 TaxID=1881055 RepID=UPI0008E4C227|nr:hypothetical protein [Nitrosomonas sp. Nm34]SFI59738.1 hypothetical protein SAMN05428978_101932 [Nitrosomonas sp. Nm34]